MKMTATLHKDKSVAYKVGDSVVLYGKITAENDDGCEIEVSKVEVPKPAKKRRKSDPMAYLKEKQKEELAEAEA